MTTLKEQLATVRAELKSALDEVEYTRQLEVAHRLNKLCVDMKKITGVEHWYGLPQNTAGKPFCISILDKQTVRGTCAVRTPKDQSCEGLLEMATQMVNYYHSEKALADTSSTSRGKVYG